jgi:hypothetical protein
MASAGDPSLMVPDEQTGVSLARPFSWRTSTVMAMPVDPETASLAEDELGRRSSTRREGWVALDWRLSMDEGSGFGTPNSSENATRTQVSSSLCLAASGSVPQRNGPLHHAELQTEHHHHRTARLPPWDSLARDVLHNFRHYPARRHWPTRVSADDAEEDHPRCLRGWRSSWTRPRSEAVVGQRQARAALRHGQDQARGPL